MDDAVSRDWRRRKAGVRVEREIRKERETLSPEAMAMLHRMGEKIDKMTLRVSALEAKIRAQDEMISSLQDMLTDRMVDTLRSMRETLETYAPEVANVAR